MVISQAKASTLKVEKTKQNKVPEDNQTASNLGDHKPRGMENSQLPEYHEIH